ncbi:TAXI family TRAP transporter solute-binding subunit [Roseococcus sp. SYP-B2431]|uniref:TAXI family TRAP transporter solute-binding subunit n=1 Tax=Roseococcus sp. SYP-B2431 TaxID=2496640 RepID=UPI00104057EF|nr:TAXI family TRAP transporter solute-binding subunit [Roseococcus sp. SYP-B2431]TCH98837.1 TAXI family TRAP transporter solute-binding subunit [Roseococcus sp. SYP-B2431]
MMRRSLLAAPAVLAVADPASAQAQPAVAHPTLAIHTAGQGSPFVTYGRAIAALLSRQGITATVEASTGSLQNLTAVEDNANALGTAFLGSAWDAVQGTPAAGNRKHLNVRALWPMYETSFQVAALTSSGLTAFAQLAGKRVGAGPARGPAETFLVAAAEAAGIRVEIVSGSPAEMTQGLLNGGMDALWQGAIVPIPSILEALARAPGVVFGPGAEVVGRVTQRLPMLAPTTLPPGTYPGQTAPIESFAAWNFIVANRALPEETAYAITRAVLTVADPARDIGQVAATTRKEAAVNNRVLPFHPGAARFYREAGLTLSAPPAG